MYLPLARKYRPQNFSEVIGQEPVLRTLTNAVTLGRIHHAFLFTGARGVGKTSLARIFAKMLDCVNGPTAEPCGKCTPCTEITRSNAMDVIELDAASHTGVDNVRDILEQVKYAPGACKYKIYIVDEAHMLTKNAFNALLKTLEEPPSHVIFILATTEPHKIPITILSRCQRFDFRKLGKNALTAHLKKILAAENVQAEDGAVDIIAECAQGSVRDALSVMDQAIGYHGKSILEADVRAMLGLGERLLVQDVFACLTRAELATALVKLSEVDASGADIKVFAENLLVCYRNLLILVAAKKPPEDVSPAEREFFAGLSAQADLSLLLAQYQILFRGLDELTRAEFQKTALEITFIKMSRAGDMIHLAGLVDYLKERSGSAPVAKLSAVPARPALSVAPTPPPAFPPTFTSHATAPAPAKREVPTASAEEIPVPEQPAATWYEFAQWVGTFKPSMGSLLKEAVPVAFAAERVEAAFAGGSPAHRLAVERRAIIERLLAPHFGSKVAFVVSELTAANRQASSLSAMEESARNAAQSKAREEIESHPALKPLISESGAKIREITILS